MNPKPVTQRLNLCLNRPCTARACISSTKLLQTRAQRSGDVVSIRHGWRLGLQSSFRDGFREIRKKVSSHLKGTSYTAKKRSQPTQKEQIQAAMQYSRIFFFLIPEALCLDKRDFVFLQKNITCHKRKAFYFCLCYKHSVKRIPVMRRKVSDRMRMFDSDIQHLKRLII